MTEQQEHLKNLLEQRANLVKNIESLQSKIDSDRQTYFKVQGAIEYLTTTGVELPEPENQPEEEPGEVVEK